MPLKENASRAVGGYAIQRATSTQSGVRFPGPPCGGRQLRCNTCSL